MTNPGAELLSAELANRRHVAPARFAADPIHARLLSVEFDIQQMRDELPTLDLTVAERARFETALRAVERQARRLLTFGCGSLPGH